jgi:hypothetical protein
MRHQVLGRVLCVVRVTIGCLYCMRHQVFYAVFVNDDRIRAAIEGHLAASHRGPLSPTTTVTPLAPVEVPNVRRAPKRAGASAFRAAVAAGSDDEGDDDVTGERGGPWRPDMTGEQILEQIRVMDPFRWHAPPLAIYQQVGILGVFVVGMCIYFRLPVFHAYALLDASLDDTGV